MEHETLRAVFDGIEDVIYVADPKTYELLHVNAAFRKSWGDVVIGRECYEVLQGRKEPCPFCTNDKIFGEHLGESYVWEFQNEITKRWYRCSDKAIRWVDGRWVRFELAADITEQKRRNERYRSIIQTTQDGFWTVDVKSARLLEVNDNYCGMTGYSKDELLNMTISDLQVSETVDETSRHIDQVLRKGKDRFDTRHRCKDGRLIDVEVSAQYLAAPYEMLVVFIRDVTAARADERALRETKHELEIRNRIAGVFLSARGEEMYSGILEVVLEALKSKYGVFGYIDEAGALVVPTMTDHTWDQCRVPEKALVFPRDQWGASIWPRAIRQKRILYSNERSSLTPEGHIPVDRNIAAPIIHGQEVIGLLHVANKETDYDEWDLKLIGTLTHMIAPVLHGRLLREQIEYLRKQAEDRLRINAVALERSNKELEQFAYVASHDLQEPLRMVASYTQLLAERYEGKLDEKADKYIGYAVDGARRMQGLINDLLAFSRVGTRGKAFKMVDCGVLVREVIRSLGKVIEEAEAEITVGELPRVPADRTQLGQVFQNLISNAVKFRSDDVPRVEISARRAGPDWEFCVADNGIGIDPHFQERVFIIFQRLHERGKYPGTGIGLTIVKKIVERHGGKVRVESAAGRGTRFLFTIPAVGGGEGAEDG